MNESEDIKPAPGLFGNISEADRLAALDTFGKLLMESRDAAIQYWDRLISGQSDCRLPAWARLLEQRPDFSDRDRQLLREALPHVVDTVLYKVLGDLEASALRGLDERVCISVSVNGKVFENLAKLSWGLAAEPAGEDGWLVRFSKTRFEQPS